MYITHVCTYVRAYYCYNSQGIQKIIPGAVVDILEHPLDKSKVPCMQVT